jgi:hypothetical protein
MKYAIHGAILFVWFAAARYALVCFERDGYDIKLVAIMFLSGFMACSQLALALSEFEEIVSKGE